MNNTLTPPKYNRDLLLQILVNYAGMIDHSGAEFPTVVLDDIRHSIDFVLMQAEKEDNAKKGV